MTIMKRILKKQDGWVWNGLKVTHNWDHWLSVMNTVIKLWVLKHEDVSNS